MYFLTTKNVDDLVSLTASSEVATFEVTKLQDPLGSARWRSTGLSPSVTGQFDSAKTIDFWGVWYHNSDLKGRARLLLANTEAELTSAPLLDENTYMWPGNQFLHSYNFNTVADVDFGDVLDQGAGSSFTVEIRYSTTTTGVTQTLASKKAPTGAGWSIFVSSGDDLVVFIDDGATGLSAIIVDVASSLDGEFHYLRVEFDRVLQVIRTYLDNVLIATSGTIAVVGSLANAISLVVGKLGGAGTDFWTGLLDEFRFWSVVPPTVILPDQELWVLSLPAGLELYWRANEGTGAVATDESTNGFNGTITNGSWNLVSREFIEGFKDIYGYTHQRALIATPISALWFRIEFDFTGNVDGFVQGGALFLDDLFRLALGPVDGLRFTPTSRALFENLMAAGGLSRGGGSEKRNLTGARLPTMTEAEAFDQFVQLYSERREVLPVGVVLDEDELIHPLDYMYYGYLSLNAGVARRDVTKFDTTFNIVEP